MPILNSRVRRAVAAAGVRQKDIADAVEMPKESISRIVNGRIPNLLTAFLLARELGCTVEDLFELDEEAA